MGDSKKQVSFLTRALEIQEKHYGKDSYEIAFTLFHLANASGEIGDFEKMKNLLTRSLQIVEKHHEEKPVGLILSRLAIAFKSTGDFKKQIDVLSRALKISEKDLGIDHPKTGEILVKLGIAWRHLGNYEKQNDFFFRAFKINEKCYGEAHPETIKLKEILEISLYEYWKKSEYHCSSKTSEQYSPKFVNPSMIKPQRVASSSRSTFEVSRWI